jgi:alpha-tubulin suppressor-like RCC1 family protein
VTLGGKGFCWGNNSVGELGLGSHKFRLGPTAVSGNLLWTGIAIGGATCGVTTDHRAYCWGDNTDGQLGDGTRTQRPAPKAVVGPR